MEEGTPDEEITTNYIGSFVYEYNELRYLLTDEGRVIFAPDGSHEYQYFLKDHLGNTRVTFNAGGIIQKDSYYPFCLTMAGLSLQIGEDLPNKYRYNGKELQDDFGLDWLDFHARFYDPAIVRTTTQDPHAENYYSESSYSFMGNNPVVNIDPTGMNYNPIYDREGEFLGTDDKGLQGRAIVMDEKNFKQGMLHEEALDYNLGAEGLNSDAAKTKQLDHKAGLKDRPDWDGFVTIDEGVQWAKDHPNTLPNNITPDNSLYLDASKLNFGDLSVDNIGLKQGQKGNVNLFDYVHWASSSSRSTTYALGNTQMKILNPNAGTVKLFWDDYNWDYHNNPPSGTRDRLIQAERWRSGVNSSHGFRMFMYGTGTIKK